MLRAVVWTLRQRRYAVLALVMFVLAVACVGAGTFELHRYREKVHDNAALRHNAHAAPAALTTAVAPLVGDHAARPPVTFRRIVVTGVYLPSATAYLADQLQDGKQGFYVVTPLRTEAGVLLVVRGFVAAAAALTPPADVAAAPAGVATVHGWLQSGQGGDDKFARMGNREIDTINPAQQSTRLGAPVYDAFVTLDAGAPGTAGLATIPFPSLSNPTGGAEQWQLASYVVQWYVFALLAVLAPFLISRSEVREARRRFLGVDEDAVQFDAPAALPDAAGVETREPAPADAAVAVRAPGTVARPGDVAARRWSVGQRLADRYGRTLGHDATPDLVADAPAPVVGTAKVRDSRAAVYRSSDDYHGDYNDYLWQLALGDGEQLTGAPRDDPDQPPPTA